MTCAAVILIEIVLFRIFNPFNNDGCFPLLGLAIDGIKFFILSLTFPCLMEIYIVYYHVMCGLFSLFSGWILVLNDEIKQHIV